MREKNRWTANVYPISSGWKEGEGDDMLLILPQLRD